MKRNLTLKGTISNVIKIFTDLFLIIGKIKVVIGYFKMDTPHCANLEMLNIVVLLSKILPFVLERLEFFRRGNQLQCCKRNVHDLDCCQLHCSNLSRNGFEPVESSEYQFSNGTFFTVINQTVINQLKGRNRSYQVITANF